MPTDCWNQIGVAGDRSCNELKTVIHCRNCPVYSTAGRGLLEREAPPDYLQEWTDLLAEDKLTPSTSEIDNSILKITQPLSVVIFRLNSEWLALPARLFKQITQPCPIHTLPHRSSDIFLGLVNIRGEILLCISLSHLLNLETIPDTHNTMSPVVYERMVVVQKGTDIWVFSVDEIYGVHLAQPTEFRDAPVVIAKAKEAYTKGMIYWQDKQVSYLDDELLFYTLNKKII